MFTTGSLLLPFVLTIMCGVLVGINAISVEKDLSMTLKEKQTLDKFRGLVAKMLTGKESYMKNDLYLIRWLRAQNFDLKSAEAMLKENFRWREVNNMKEIANEDFEDILRDFPTTVDTHDKAGRPIGVIDFNEWNIRDGVLSGRGPRIVRYLHMLMDNLTMQVFQQQQAGLNVTQWKVLGNLDGFSLITHACPICLPYWVQFVSTIDNYYPGWMDELITIESPRVAQRVFDMLSPLVSKQTRDAITLLGTNKNQWMKYLNSKISPEERRQAYGGTKPPAERI